MIIIIYSKFHANNFSYFEISGSLFRVPHPKTSNLNKHWLLLIEEIWHWCISVLVWLPKKLLLHEFLRYNQQRQQSVFSRPIFQRFTDKKLRN